MYLFWYLYFSIVGIALYYRSNIALVVVLLFGLFTVIFLSVSKKIKLKNLKNLVKCLLNDNSYNFTSFVKINKDSWELFNELPGFSSVAAKRVVWIRKHSGKYTSIEDFFEKNNIKEENQDVLRKILVVK